MQNPPALSPGRKDAPSSPPKKKRGRPRKRQDDPVDRQYGALPPMSWTPSRATGRPCPSLPPPAPAADPTPEQPSLPSLDDATQTQNLGPPPAESQNFGLITQDFSPSHTEEPVSQPAQPTQTTDQDAVNGTTPTSSRNPEPVMAPIKTPDQATSSGPPANPEQTNTSEFNFTIQPADDKSTVSKLQRRSFQENQISSKKIH